MSNVYLMLKKALVVKLFLMLLLTLSGTASAQSLYTVQIESVPSLDQARVKIQSLRSQGLDIYVVKSVIEGKGTFYRLRTGTFTNQNEARKYAGDLKRQGIIPDFYIAQYEAPTPLSVLMADVQPPRSNARQSGEERPRTLNNSSVESSGAKGTGAIRDNTPAQISEPPVRSTPIASAPPPQRPLANVEESRVNSGESSLSLSSINFVKFEDTVLGYSFDRPLTWTGGALDVSKTKDQQPTGGALFKSYENVAFIHVIWNNFDKANSPDNNNDLVVELILKSMGTSEETKELKETSRRVVQESGLIKTFLELKAVFKADAKPGETQIGPPLDFFGKAIIIRAPKGILVVSTFYTKDSPGFVTSIADRVMASARAPQ